MDAKTNAIGATVCVPAHGGDNNKGSGLNEPNHILVVSTKFMVRRLTTAPKYFNFVPIKFEHSVDCKPRGIAYYITTPGVYFVCDDKEATFLDYDGNRVQILCVCKILQWNDLDLDITENDKKAIVEAVKKYIRG